VCSTNAAHAAAPFNTGTTYIRLQVEQCKHSGVLRARLQLHCCSSGTNTEGIDIDIDIDISDVRNTPAAGCHYFADVYAAAIVTTPLTLGPALLEVLLLPLLLLTMRLSYTRSASSDAPTASSHGLCLQQQRQQRQTGTLTGRCNSNTQPLKQALNTSACLMRGVT
jgi:hypothetical protein